MPTPSECRSLSQVREEIDHLDEQMVALLGKRAGYVNAAARFKTSETAVAAPERLAAMLARRRQWAEREGLDPDLIEDIFRRLVAWFIQRELEEWRSR
ncbi:MAG TPA: isochorismate lyase [Candidatus Acidoferrales bacterium]|jgi:isochorismate pyruvate lyase|nr:isochorismate lyase [Candidatus Acidoferrales bacterium]